MNHNFKKKYGQNFLSDKNLLQAIVADADVSENDNVLEIGAGAGALTTFLSQKAKKVIAYEIDNDLEGTLHALQLKHTKFVFKDALKENIGEIEMHFGGKKYKLVANLPYYITTPLLFKFLEESDNVTSLTVMVQKEVAERITAKPGSKDYGILTVMIAFWGDAVVTRNVGRQMFYPQPNVDSAVVNIVRHQNYKDVDRIGFYNFVKACFSMRRKTLANNLSFGLKISKTQLNNILPAEALSRRAETFSLDEFVDLYYLTKKY